uniref:Ubiquitin carboxyl-terminal hydrolase n=1 Tax=Kalanchoe fedtschenkoi TaxID=63787 RepID=A0A7N0V6W1_KALFE
MAFKLQMNWQTTLLNQKRKTGPPLGLRNQGNTCYLNSVLQCLTYTPPLANFCLNHLHTSNSLEGNKKRDCPFCILEKRIARSLSTELSLDTPAKINNCLRIFADHFRCGRQEDAHEFLRYVIDACHNTCLRIKKLSCKGGDFLNDNTVVKEIFGGALQSQVKCLTCGNESNKVDEIMDLSLDVVRSSSVKDALHKFFLPEVLDGNNKYKCENCKTFVSARKQMSILQAPNVLVIQLKRFEGIFGGKIDKDIAFEEVLVLSSFICKATTDQHQDYKLFGTIVHSGYSPESGHYYAYVKDAVGRWYCCNDSFVTLSSLQEVLSEKVYILFFSRTNQRASPTGTYFSSNGILSSASSGTNKPCTVNGNKSCISHGNGNGNGNGITKIPKTVDSDKKLLSTLIAEDSLVGTSSTLLKIDRIQMKFSLGTSGSKRVSATSDLKQNMSKDQVLKKNGEMGRTYHVKGNESDKTLIRLPAQDYCSGKDKRTEVNNKFIAASQDSKTSISCLPSQHSLACGSSEVSSELTDARKYESQGLHNGVRSYPSNSRLKRKSSDENSNCTLLSEALDSCSRLWEFRHTLQAEASLNLRSCGWSDEVYRFMRERKKLHVLGESSQLEGAELRKKLIAEAKSNFVSQVPEALKWKLVEMLESCSQMKQTADT